VQHLGGRNGSRGWSSNVLLLLSHQFAQRRRARRDIPFALRSIVIYGALRAAESVRPSCIQ
jgi:hypothetical protein